MLYSLILKNNLLTICFFRIQIENVERSCKLTIENSVRTESGKYRIVVKNEGGEINKSIEVKVNGEFQSNIIYNQLNAKINMVLSLK